MFCNIVTICKNLSSKFIGSLSDIKVHIRNVLSGDSQDFEEIVIAYQSMVFTICLNVLNNRELAEEAAQDVFIKVFKKLGSFEERSSFKTWVYRIAYRTAIDYQRKKRLLTTTIDNDERPMRLAAPQISSHEALERDDREKMLERAIRKLDEEDSLIISLYYYEEKSIKEVGSVLEMTESNVKIRLFRARKKLKLLLSNSEIR